MSEIHILMQQRQAIDEQIEQLRTQEKAGALAQIKTLVEQYDISLIEAKGCFPAMRKSLGGKPRAKRSSSVLFTNPANPAETYKGNGRRPGWLSAMGAEQQEACKTSL